MNRRTGRTESAAFDPCRILLYGAGLAVVWLLAWLAFKPAPAAAAESETLLRSNTFGSTAERPIRRRRPYYERDRGYQRQSPYGFLNVGGGIFDPSDQPGTGFYGVVAVGSEVADPLDLGVQLSWYHRGSRGEEVVFTYTDPAGNTVERVIETRSVDTDLLPIMGIARLRFPTSRYLQPYIGGGVGYEWLFVEGVDENGVPFSNDYGGFGAQLMGGLNISASPSTALYGEVAYNFSTVKADFFDPSLNTVVKESIDMDGLAFHGGLRFRF